MKDPFIGGLGMEGEVTAPGQARVWATVQPGHLNNLGMAHGGFLFTMADAAFAFASNSSGIPAVALSTHMEFVKAAQLGDNLEAVARELHVGYRTGLYQIEIRKGEELIASFTGTVYRKQPK